jgi:hypothetical protein
MILLKESSSCLKTNVLINVRSYNIFVVISVGATLAEYARIDEKLAYA